jgi:hypothetical protein
MGTGYEKSVEFAKVKKFCQNSENFSTFFVGRTKPRNENPRKENVNCNCFDRSKKHHIPGAEDLDGVSAGIVR